MKKKQGKSKKQQSANKHGGSRFQGIVSDRNQQTAQSNDTQEHKKHQANNTEDKRMSTAWGKVQQFMVRQDAAEWTMAVLTFFIVVLTLATTWFNCHQISIYEESTHSDLRAYLQVLNPRDDRFNEQPILWISIVNFGKTPATNVSVAPTFSLWIRDILPIEPTFYKRDASRGFMIAPNETLYVPLRHSLDFWREDTTSTAQAFGVVYYDDHRGEAHKTIFAYQWEHISRSYRKMAHFNYGD
ncbi:hypothetical protein D4R75_01150 [bacterium]|nr:MAG: hypothetical protein D4R75_01150 [bacterium]